MLGIFFAFLDRLEDRRGIGDFGENVEILAADPQLLEDLLNHHPGLAPLFAADPFELIEILGPQNLGDRHVAEDHQLILPPLPDDQVVIGHMGFDQAQIDLVVLDLLHDLPAHFDDEFHIVVDHFAQGIETLSREDIVADGEGGSQFEGDLFVDDLENVSFGFMDTLLQPHRDFVELLPGVGETDPVLLAFDHLGVQVPLDELDLLGHRRLGDPQLGRSPGEASLPHHRQKCLQFREIFQHSPLLLPLS